MGKEPKNVIKRKIKRILINHCIIDEVHIDLEHINYGIDLNTNEYNRKKRSSFTVEDVINWLNEINKKEFDLVGKNEEFLYYISEREIKEKSYKMVFWVDEKRTNVLGVITIYCVGNIKKR